MLSEGDWTPAGQLQTGDLVSAMHGPAEVLGVAFGNERVPVYNLSVPGSPTYFVGEHGTWVHNCSIFKWNLGDHVLQRKHNRDKLGVMSLEQTKPFLRHVMQHGSEFSRFPIGTIGESIKKTMRIRGHDIDVQYSVFSDGTVRVVDGWVR